MNIGLGGGAASSMTSAIAESAEDVRTLLLYNVKTRKWNAVVRK